MSPVFRFMCLMLCQAGLHSLDPYASHWLIGVHDSTSVMKGIGVVIAVAICVLEC